MSTFFLNWLYIYIYIYIYIYTLQIRQDLQVPHSAISLIVHTRFSEQSEWPIQINCDSNIYLTVQKVQYTYIATRCFMPVRQVIWHSGLPHKLDIKSILLCNLPKHLKIFMVNMINLSNTY